MIRADVQRSQTRKSFYPLFYVLDLLQNNFVLLWKA